MDTRKNVLPHAIEANNKGFSLVEMAIVVAVIGVLAAIAIPIFSNYMAVSKQKTAENVLEQFPILLETFRADNGRFPLDGTYTYTENNAGVPNDEISATPEAAGTAAALTEFSPKSTTSTDPILYHYSLTINNSNTTNEQATYQATPQVNRGAPAGVLGPFIYQ